MDFLCIFQLIEMGIVYSRGVIEYKYNGDDRCGCGNIASYKRDFQTKNNDPNYVHNYHPTIEKYHIRSKKIGEITVHEFVCCSECIKNERSYAYQY